MSSDLELNALAGLDPGFDGDTDGVDGEEHDDGENETEEVVQAGVSQLGTDGLGTHIWDGSSLIEDSTLTVLLLPQTLLHS